MYLRTGIRVADSPDSSIRSRAVARAIIAEMSQSPLYQPLEMEGGLWHGIVKLRARRAAIVGGGMFVAWLLVKAALWVWGWM